MDSETHARLRKAHGLALREASQDLDKWNLTTANKQCPVCNGTGVERQETMFGSCQIITVVCQCVTKAKEV